MAGKSSGGVKTKLRSALNKVSSYLMYFIFSLGILVIVGWFLDVEWIKRPIPGLVAMNPLTAICFILTAIAFCLGSKKKSFSYFVAVLTGTIVIGHLILLILDTSFQLDQLVFKGRLWVEAEGTVSNRMAPNTAICFLLSNAAIILLKRDYLPYVTQILALLVIILAGFSIIGYAYKAEEYYGMLEYFPMAIHTAIGFFLLQLALLFRTSNKAIMREITSPLTGGFMARLLLPLSVTVTFLAGFFASLSHRLLIISDELGITLVICTLIISNGFFIWKASAKINQKEKLRIKAEEKNLLTSTLLKSSINSLNDMSIISIDKQYRCISFNTSFQKGVRKIYGVEIDHGQSLWSIILNEKERLELKDKCKRVFKGEIITEEKFIKEINAWHEKKYRPIYDHNHDIIGMTLFVSDITERRVREAKLEEANKELEAFSYTVAHDLRAPLRIIDGYITILNEDYKDLDEGAQRLFEVISRNAVKMGNLIDELLSFAKLGRQSLSLSHVDFEKLINEVLSEQISLMENQNIEVIIGKIENFNCDRALIRQVLVNLISNALKYSQKKDKIIIEIGCFENNNEITYYIKDNGAGFNMQYSDKIFGVFERLHKDSEFEGTGVGLAIVQKIIKKHGGEIWAEAEEGNGATFYFTMPQEQTVTQEIWTLN
ncbi:PAS domain-containing sensor histidine kinase [Fulvivirga ligni]|uniref:PAS domain-containing sensor histidine kinase n=1 Tax=Fulvivirga ligni TaxID=2904246 RepID=UPI001F31472F|nr:ATP-binding protein [Fulvivirga ligni]UII24081.1 ATP-binding protein [Fulvivirga ligni]